MQEALSAAQNAVHSIFDASSGAARLAAAREGRGPHRPHSAEQPSMTFNHYLIRKTQHDASASAKQRCPKSLRNADVSWCFLPSVFCTYRALPTAAFLLSHPQQQERALLSTWA